MYHSSLLKVPLLIHQSTCTELAQNGANSISTLGMSQFTDLSKPCMAKHARVCALVTQSCLTLCNLMDCSWPGSSVHGILQSRILEWIDIPFSRVSSWSRDWTLVSCIAGRFFTVWAPREALNAKIWLYKESTCLQRHSVLYKKYLVQNRFQ